MASQLLGLLKVGRAQEVEGDNGVIVDERVAAFIVLDRDLHEIVERSPRVPNVLLVTADEAAPGAGSTDKLKAARPADILAQRLGPTNFHGALLEIDMDEVGGDAGGVKALEEVIRHGERLPSLALNLTDNGIGAWVDHAIRTSDVVLEGKKYIAVRQGIQIFCLARIDLFTGGHHFTRRT